MRERLTSDDLFSYILMLRPVSNRIILLIEGDADYTALRTHVNQVDVNPIPGYGKGIIEPAMALVNSHKIPNVIALLDKDFGDLFPKEASEPNIFYTDHYDLDATIFFSGKVCERMAYSFGNIDQINSLLSDLDCPDLAIAATNLAMAVGVLRFISVRERIHLRLREFPLGEVVRDDCRSVDLEALVTLALRRESNRQTARPREIVTQMQVELAKISNPYAYCSGHDLARALSVLLRKRGGVSLRPDIIEKALRGAFNCSEIRATRLYSDLAIWARHQNKNMWSCDSRT